MKAKTEKKSFQIVAGLWTALLCCCARGVAQNVHYNFMPGTNFADFHTFKWVGYIGGFEQVNQILAQEIQDAVVGQLTGKGFTQTNADNADLIVGFQVAMQAQRQWNAWGAEAGVLAASVRPRAPLSTSARSLSTFIPWPTKSWSGPGGPPRP
jgi:hypothetical protein